MANKISIFCAIIGLILCFISGRRNHKINYNCLTLGLAMLFIAFFAQLLFNSMRIDIEKREMTQTTEEELVYDLISIESNNENTEFFFYYRTEVNGVEVFDNKTISSENVFIIETNQCRPMVIETLATYEYEIDGFERWWLDEQYLEEFAPKTVQSYEIYVPEGTIKREYNLN